jgi:hypothetical protein
MGLYMGKPMGQYPFPITSTQNPKMDPKIGLASLFSASHCTPSLESCCSPKSGQVLPSTLKLGQGPTGPQYSPVTRPESLRSDQFYFKRIDLGSISFDLLQCDNLLFSKFLDDYVIEQSFQALFCSDDTLFEFSSLAFKFREQLLSLKFRPHRATRTPHHQHRKTVIHGTRINSTAQQKGQNYTKLAKKFKSASHPWKTSTCTPYLRTSGAYARLWGEKPARLPNDAFMKLVGLPTTNGSAPKSI